MKVSYNIKSKTIVTWWNEELGTGEPDEIYPGDEIEKKIYDFPDIINPSALPYGLQYYEINNGELILSEEKTKELNIKTYHPDLPQLNRENALNDIDQAAENVRKSFITALPGQMLSYSIKEAEARQFIADNRPTDISDYKMLTAESKGRKIDISELADIIIAKADEWILITANIESIRLQYKDLIKSLNIEKVSIDDIKVIVEEATRLLQEI